VALIEIILELISIYILTSNGR